MTSSGKKINESAKIGKKSAHSYQNEYTTRSINYVRQQTRFFWIDRTHRNQNPKCHNFCRDIIDFFRQKKSIQGPISAHKKKTFMGRVRKLAYCFCFNPAVAARACGELFLKRNVSYTCESKVACEFSENMLFK